MVCLSFIVCIWLLFLQKVPFPTTPVGKKLWALRRGKVDTDMTITTSTTTLHAHMVMLVSCVALMQDSKGLIDSHIRGLSLKISKRFSSRSTGFLRENNDS